MVGVGVLVVVPILQTHICLGTASLHEIVTHRMKHTMKYVSLRLYRIDDICIHIYIYIKYVHIHIYRYVYMYVRIISIRMPWLEGRAVQH